jgi:putative NADH-flavin reductase
MHFLLLGATGRTGTHVVTELLAQGHTAVALIRPTASLIPRPGLTIVTGSPLSRSDIQSALNAAPSLRPDAAIYTLNTVRKTESPFAPQLSPPRFLADSCAATCDILEQAGIHRIVIMSTAGAGDSWANLPWLSKAFMGWTNVKLALLDHNDVDKEVRKTSMDWTLVRASRLEFVVGGDNTESGESKGEVVTLNGAGLGMKVTDSVNVARAARFLVQCAVEGRYIREAVVIRD